MMWRTAFGGLITVHGLIHLIGAAAGLGLVDDSTWARPVSTTMGAQWLLTALLLIVTGLLIALGEPKWWVCGLLGLVLSQGVIVRYWHDASLGTIPNVLLGLALGYTLVSRGPRSYRAQFVRNVDQALAAVAAATRPAGAEASSAPVVTEHDLDGLPPLVAGYVRASGAVGQPPVKWLRASISGRIRGGPDKPWMTFTGEQVDTFGTCFDRVFYIDATMFGLPVDVLHVYAGESAIMRVKLCSLKRMVNATGPELDRAETVTVFNDLCVMAPGALVHAPVVWKQLDERHVHGTFTRRGHKVSALLTFDDTGRLVDFVSDDRLRASADGTHFTPQRWSTPLTDYRDFGPATISSFGEARWHAPAPEGEFAYLEFRIDDLTFGHSTVRSQTAPSH